MSAAYEAALTDTVRTALRNFSRAWSDITCDDLSPILRFFDYSDPGVIDGNETAVTEYPGDAWPRLLRARACGRTKEVATLDSSLVRILTPDIATVSWTFHATYFDSSGATRQARGAVLQVFRRTPDGWKTPVGMSTHQPVEQRP